MSKEVFKGVRQVNSGTTEFENGYLYLIRTNENGTAGKIYFNGRIYSFDDAELKKIIEDDEEVISMALNDLNKKITDAERQGEEVVTAITSLNTRVSNIESQTGETASQISNLSTRISSVEADMETAISAVTGLDERVTDIEDKEASWDAKQDEIADINEIRSNAASGATAFSAVTGLDERVTDIEDYEEVIATAFTDLNTRISDVEGKEASWDAKQNTLSAGTNINITNNVISTDGVATTSQLESHTQDTGIHVTALDKTTWDNKQDELVSGENIKTINGESILGEGNLTVNPLLLTEITYSSLKTLRDNDELVPGMQYRITDYQCTTTQAGTTSAGHQFDIIVTADSENVINEHARAIIHSGDTYFNGCRLEAWDIRYHFDNDSSKFAWADETNGKGIIYYMKDEFDNECPYDFKNIQFYRKWNTDTQLWSDNATSSDGVAAYTFSSDGFTESITEFTDFSIDSSNYISSNIIKRRTSADNHMIDDLLRLNNICFFGNTCYFNIFGENCYNNTLVRLCRNNTFGADCYSNSLFGTSGYNTFSNGCSFNVLASYCQYNTFGDDCDYNRLGVGCTNNVFGKKCCYNNLSSGNIPTVDGGCSNNVFGSGCGDLDSKSGIILHRGSCSNIFDANIKNVELAGENIKNYHILSSASHEGTTEGIEFTQEFLTDIVIHSINDEEIVVSFFDTYDEVQCDNVTLYYDSEEPEGIHWWAYDEDWTYYVATDSTSDINCQIGDDIEFVEYPGKLTINATPDSEVVITVARKSNGKIVQYCEADMIVDQD